MNILIIGQCTLHWGRMEFGNIGNYYIIEPLIRELHKVFENSTIKTTFQMSERFCKEEKVEVIPMEYYYDFESDNNLQLAQKEYNIALLFSKTGEIQDTTPYMEEVLNSDLVIDFSGDIWGENADFLGKNRFLVGLYKDRIAQLLGKKCAMIAGSPGPFNNDKNLLFAKEVFQNFDLVTNREAISREILKSYGFNLDNLKDLSCPAFLFEQKNDLEISKIDTNFIEKDNIIGLVICGWNFLNGPFDLWPRDNSDYDFIVNPIIEFLKNHKEIIVCLLSHSNGFIPGKKPFELIHGRDYPIMKQIESILIDKGFGNQIFCLDGVYDAWTTKAIISNFKMLISGRVHAAVAGMSQYVPTVIIDYGHEPKAHKLKGFANEAGMLKLVAEPDKKEDIISKIEFCWKGREELKQQLINNIPVVKNKAKMNFQLLKELF